MYIWCRHCHRLCHIALHSSYGRTLLVPNHARQETSIRWPSNVGIRERTFHEKNESYDGWNQFQGAHIVVLCFTQEVLLSFVVVVHYWHTYTNHPIIPTLQRNEEEKDEHRAAQLSFFIRDSRFIFLRRHASICNCIGCALLLHLYIDIYCIQHPHPSTLHPEESSFEWS